MTEAYAPHWSRDEMRKDVGSGLARPQKELPPKYFYDTRGSELFEEITQLDEYYPTNAERRLLETRIPGWIDALRPASLVELGAGSAEKTRIILEAMLERRSEPAYVPVDIAADFLRASAADLTQEYPTLRITPVAGDITEPAALDLPDLERPAVFALLGGTIGNFRPRAASRMLEQVAAIMADEDRFLLGVDLKKDVAVIEAAYNDAAGVTAAFNRNMLRVLNREVGTDFDLDAFEHRAFYNADRHRIEMHLVSTRDQTVHVPAVGDFPITSGESIRTELSHKYDRAIVDGMFADAGLAIEHWITGDERMFGLVVGMAAP